MARYMSVIHFGAAAICALAYLSAPAASQDTAKSEEASSEDPGPCTDAAYRAFDFWLGVWDVETPDGQIAGRNLITSEEDGCLVLEQWMSAGGTTGQSYNYYNPATAKWHQTWVSRDAVIEYSGGPEGAAAMRLNGTISYRDGTRYPFRGEWVPQDGGVIRQSFEQYNYETGVWESWFVGLYRPATETDG
ncbi:MAG: hypothetical protein AAFQ84_04280 [Pseudomonadota bacterium]